MEVTVDFPFVESLPKREKSKLAKLWDLLLEVHQLSKERGQHWPVRVAAEALGISRQRIHQLIDDGRLEVVDVGGRKFVSMSSMQAYAEDERRTGRGVKPSPVEWQKCLEIARKEIA